MNIKLGLLGPHDSMQVIQTALAKYPEFHCTPIECLTEQDLARRVLPIKEEFDMWLCSGPITYLIVSQWGEIHAPIFCVPYNGSSLYKTLLQVIYEQKVEIAQISFDSYKEVESEAVPGVEEALLEAGITDKPHYIMNETYEMDEVKRYHTDLWEKGLIKATITAHPIDNELRQLGLPTYRILPATMAIAAVASQMLRTFEMLYFKNTQIAIQMIDTELHDGLTSETLSSDDLTKLEIGYTDKLLTYAKKVHGSLKSVGRGRYAIFTTRGLLQEITQDFQMAPEIQGIDQQGRKGMTCGIGIGQTAYEAEINATNALLHAKKCGTGSWVVCFDDKKIAGPLGKPEQITYSYASEELHAISKATSLGVSTLQKLKSVLRKLSSEEISSQELAQYMQITQRSARRILTELEEKGFAEIVAEEKPYMRGRPRKVYKILLEQKV